MKTFRWTILDEADRAAVLARPAQRSDTALEAAVAATLCAVRDGGWAALCQIAQRIDGAEPRRVAVAEAAAQARRSMSAEELAAIEFAVANVGAFHQASRPSDVEVETAPGLVVRKLWRPIDRVGLYVPGGTSPLFSTLLMLAIPAAVAAVRELVVVTPPRGDGSLSPAIALAAELCGIEAVWTVGGAQAIGALAFGAGEIGKVDKICGPGNAWVSEAKRQVASMSGGPAIDMPAGPSELLIIADGGADPALVASDLLSQAEHDPMAQVLLVSPSEDLAGRVVSELGERLASLPRAEIARAALEQARIIVTDNLQEAAEVANLYAPEHLSLAVGDPDALLPLIRNAGAVFAGGAAAETFSDYLAGSSHVLPTDGAARAWSGVGVHTFMKAMTVQALSAEAARRVAGPAALLARMEGLEAHARAADARLEVVQ